jgi:hypothetical protein
MNETGMHDAFREAAECVVPTTALPLDAIAAEGRRQRHRRRAVVATTVLVAVAGAGATGAIFSNGRSAGNDGQLAGDPSQATPSTMEETGSGAGRDPLNEAPAPTQGRLPQCSAELETRFLDWPTGSVADTPIGAASALVAASQRVRLDFESFEAPNAPSKREIVLTERSRTVALVIVRRTGASTWVAAATYSCPDAPLALAGS